MPRSIFACDARMAERPQNELRMGQGIIVYLQSPVEPLEGSKWTKVIPCCMLPYLVVQSVRAIVAKQL